MKIKEATMYQKPKKKPRKKLDGCHGAAKILNRPENREVKPEETTGRGLLDFLNQVYGVTV